MRKTTQQELASLIKVYQNSRDILLDKIINSGGAGTKVYANTILKQLELELKRMEKQSAYYVQSVIPKEYKDGLNAVYEQFKKNKLLMKQPEIWASIHTDAIYALAREMQYQVGQGLEQVGRQITRYVNTARDDALRMAGLEASAEKLASGSTVRQMRDNLIKKLQAEGFMTVQYGEGTNAYQVSLDSYASMVARSTTREAGNISRENQLTENGYDLVQMSTHYPTCSICAQFQGRVFSISGKDKRFPPLSRAFSSGYHNIHPNCRHVVVAWIESLQTDEEILTAQARSNAPFEDTRQKAQIDLYNKQQAQNRQHRQDLYQYERYKARLAKDAPQSFSAFRRMKNADDDKWSKMQLDYKRRNKLISKPDLALPEADNAYIETPKFTNYFFGGDNKDGLTKGVAFSSHLGYNISNWKEFEIELLEKAKVNPAKFISKSPFGKKFNQPMVVYGKTKNPMDILVVWEQSKKGTRFITAYPNNKGGE